MVFRSAASWRSALRICRPRPAHRLVLIKSRGSHVIFELCASRRSLHGRILAEAAENALGQVDIDGCTACRLPARRLDLDSRAGQTASQSLQPMQRSSRWHNAAAHAGRENGNFAGLLFGYCTVILRRTGVCLYGHALRHRSAGSSSTDYRSFSYRSHKQ